MIAIGDPQVGIPAGTLHAPGGFCWWYLDLIDPAGDGLVLIWSYGLPFLPGYADAARRGRGTPPRDRPSVNLVAYRAGRAVAYLLQEYPPNRADGSAGSDQRIGDCRFSHAVDSAGALRVSAELDCPVPGSSRRIRGTVELHGAARRGWDPAPDVGASHLWTPMGGPLAGEAHLRFGDQPLLDVAGRGYHDRNHGSLPLHALGIDRWIWGRFPLADRERIVYLLWPDDGAAPRFEALDVMGNGETRPVPGLRAELVGGRRTLGGLHHPATVELTAEGRPWSVIRHLRVADSGPFYLRFQSELTTAAGERALGWAEQVHPARVDLARHRPLVRMRVHAPAGPNSIWAPLFSGPAADRVGRLVRHALRPRAAPQ